MNINARNSSQFFFSTAQPIFHLNQFAQNVFKNQKLKENQFSTHWPVNLPVIAVPFCCGRENQSGCLKLHIPWGGALSCADRALGPFSVQSGNRWTSSQFMSPERRKKWMSIITEPCSVGASLALGENGKRNVSWIAVLPPSPLLTCLTKAQKNSLKSTHTQENWDKSNPSDLGFHYLSWIFAAFLKT